MNSKQYFVGKKLVRPVTMDKGCVEMEGTIIYVDPKGRFYRVRFHLENGYYLTESYCVYGPLGSGALTKIESTDLYNAA